MADDGGAEQLMAPWTHGSAEGAGLIGQPAGEGGRLPARPRPCRVRMCGFARGASWCWQGRRRERAAGRTRQLHGGRTRYCACCFPCCCCLGGCKRVACYGSAGGLASASSPPSPLSIMHDAAALRRRRGTSRRLLARTAAQRLRIITHAAGAGAGVRTAVLQGGWLGALAVAWGSGSPRRALRHHCGLDRRDRRYPL